MTRSEIDDFVDEVVEPGVVVYIPDNLDEGFIGLTLDDDDNKVRAVYSIEKCIKKLAEDMSHEEATEFFWYNVASASGEGYPLYISTPEDGSVY